MTDESAIHRTTLGVASAGTFLVLLAYTIPIGVLDATFGALGADARARAWIVSSMSVGLAAALLPSGSIADAVGRRRVFLIGAVTLGLGSLGAALAQGSADFVAARVVQGIGGGALTSCSLGLLGATFPDPVERTRVSAIWGASLGAGIAVGPLVAASLLRLGSFRAGHVVCLLLAVGLVFAARRLPPDPVVVRIGFDRRGTAWWVVGLVALLSGLVELRIATRAPTTLAVLGTSVVALVAFVLSQRTSASPILDLALFRRAPFVGATVAAFTTGLGLIATVSFLSILIARGFGESLVVAAGTNLVWAVPSVIASAAARRLPERFTPRSRLVVALLTVALGQAGLAGLGPDDGVLRLVPGLLLAGVASGLLNATLARQSVASVPSARAAMGSGANNTARYVGAAFGMTIVAMFVGHVPAASVVPAWNVAVVVTTAFSAIGAAIVFLCRWDDAPAAESTIAPASA